MAQKSHFWASYSDLMTSLFFVMLILFILTVVMLQQHIEQVERERNATKAQLDKIREIEEGVGKIDSTLFKYNPTFKKHILKIDVSFPTGQSDINNIDESTLSKLKAAGETVEKFINDAYKSKNVQYLLIIEGQASKDNYERNYALSYERALALYLYWTEKSGIVFDKDACEVIISGSGQNGLLRVYPDDANNKANQRFLIHIVPKPGIISEIK